MTDRACGVLLVTDVYPPDCGGSGWSVHALARVLQGRGHAVEVVAIDPRRHGLTQRTFEGVWITEMGLRRARRSLRRRLGAPDYGHADLQAYLEVRLADDPGLDLVHAQHLHSGPPALMAARRRGRGAVLTVRDYWPVCLHGTSWWGGERCPGCSTARLTGCMNEYFGWPTPLARAMVPWARRRLEARRRGVASAHHVVAVSDAVRSRLQPELPDVDIRVVPNIVDPATIDAEAGAGPEPPADDSLYLLTAGKLERTKGFDLLLEEIAATSRQPVGAGASPRPAATGVAVRPLLVAGEGSERRRLQRQARQLGVDARFLGWVDHRRLLRLLRGAWAFVLPSAWDEPLSRLLLESMALGVPVVAWARGGSPEVVVDGDNGFLVHRPGNLAAALVALEAEDRRNAVAEAARRTAERRFCPDAVYPQVAEIYTSALALAGRGDG